MSRALASQCKSGTSLPICISFHPHPEVNWLTLFSSLELETQGTGNVQVVRSFSDHLALGLTHKQGQKESASTTSGSSVFKPYESALRMFRDYRFHPEYEKTVAGGLKSLTYSHQMDPFKELCPYELAKQQCPEKCEYQHFADIVPGGEFCPYFPSWVANVKALFAVATCKNTPRLPPRKLTPGLFPFLQMIKSFWNLATRTGSSVRKRRGSSRACASCCSSSRPTT